MAGLLDGKVAIITGGRQRPRRGLRQAVRQGRRQRSWSTTWAGRATAPAPASPRRQKVVDAIKAAGGKAVANGDDVSTVQGGENILKAALDAFGRVDILVCNAGILRDKTFANTSEADWDAVVKVHLKGTYCMRPAGLEAG